MPQGNKTYEALIALPHAALPPETRGPLKQRVELKLIGDDFYWLKRIEASSRVEAAKQARVWFFRSKRGGGVTKPLKIEESLTVTDPYNEVKYKDKLKCCSWNYRFLEEDVIDRLILESQGRLRRTTRKKSKGHVTPCVEWNTNAKVNRWVEKKTILNTGKRYIYFNSLTERFIARIKIKAQKTVGHKVKMVTDARTKRANGKTVWNSLTIINHIKGKRIQERKYKEFRLEAKNMYEAEKETKKLIQKYSEA